MNRILSTKWFGVSRLAFVLLGSATFSVLAAARGGRQPYRSPFDLAFAPEGGTLAVSDRTAGRLYLLDVSCGPGSPRDRIARPTHGGGMAGGGQGCGVGV